MDFKTYLNQIEFKVSKEEENYAYYYKKPLNEVDGVATHYQIVHLPYVSQGDMKRIRAMHSYLSYFNNVTCDSFSEMIKSMPNFVKVIKSYPNASFKASMQDLVKYGPQRFAEEINNVNARPANKTSGERSL